MEKGDDFTHLVSYVEERTVLEERLQKMEGFRGQIKEIIFRRVQRDYTTRLTTIRDQFRPVLIEIIKKLKNVQQDEDRLRERMEATNDALAELRFRNEIGEFEETDFHEQEDGLLLKLEELAAAHDELRRTVGDYMFYLHDDKDFRQMATAEKILERLEEDFKAERARASELEQARWQAQRQAAPVAVSPSRLPAAAGLPGSVASVDPADAGIADDDAGFLAEAFTQMETDALPSPRAGGPGNAPENPGSTAPPAKEPPTPAPRIAAPTAAGAAPSPRRVADSRTDSAPDEEQGHPQGAQHRDLSPLSVRASCCCGGRPGR